MGSPLRLYVDNSVDNTVDKSQWITQFWRYLHRMILRHGQQLGYPNSNLCNDTVGWSRVGDEAGYGFEFGFVKPRFYLTGFGFDFGFVPFSVSGFGLDFAVFWTLAIGFGFVQALISARRRRQSDTSLAPRWLFFTRRPYYWRVRLIQSQKAAVDLFQIGYLWRICPQAKYRNQLVDGGKSGRPS